MKGKTLEEIDVSVDSESDSDSCNDAGRQIEVHAKPFSADLERVETEEESMSIDSEIRSQEILHTPQTSKYFVIDKHHITLFSFKFRDIIYI